jgi:hypothetical protein
MKIHINIEIDADLRRHTGIVRQCAFLISEVKAMSKAEA